MNEKRQDYDVECWWFTLKDKERYSKRKEHSRLAVIVMKPLGTMALVSKMALEYKPKPRIKEQTGKSFSACPTTSDFN